MKIIRGYFLKEFFRFFLIVLLSSTAIMIVAEFFDKVDEFYSKKSPLYLILLYLFLLIPKFMVYSSAVASLLSILISIGIASKWKETIAVKASGGSLKRLFSSFLILGLFITLLVFILNETVVPAATRRASWVRNVKILERSLRITYGEKALWLKGLDGSLIRIRDFVEDKNKVLGISIFSFNTSFGMEKRIEAEKAEWINGGWRLENVTVFDFNSKTHFRYGSFFTTVFEEPKIFREEMKKPEEMNFIELHGYYNRLEKAGFKNIKYMIRLYEKITYPIINFVMMIFGLALSLNTRLGGGIRAAGLGIIIIVLYWLVHSISITLGNTNTIPPWSAPWVGPLIFGTAGFVLFLRIKE